MKIRYFFPLLLLVLSSCTDKDVFFENAQCYTDVNVIDAEQGIRENMTVVVHNGRIARISPSEELILSSNNNIIDGSGKYMIPGLWDAHVHFSYLEELAPIMFNLFLAYGVTSVRDTGGDINFTSMWRARAKSNPEDAPRVMIAGPLLDGSPNVYDGSSPSRPKLSVEIKSRQDALITTDMYIESGVDFIKAYEMLSPEEFITVCNVANGAGLKVTGHVPLSMDVIAASNAGLNSMEHLRNLEMSCATNSEELLQDRIQLLEAGKDDQGGVLRSRIHGAQRIKAIENQDDQRTDEVLTVLRKNQTWQIPTLALISGFVERPFLSEDWQKSIDLLPDSIADNWKKGIKTLSEQEIPENTKKYAEWALSMTKKVHDMDIGIMAGTDCPIFYLTPGRSLHQELAIFSKAGLDPLEVLKTATLRPAQYFGLESELGLIKEGYIADLVLLNKNPLDDIQNTLEIDAVIKSGKYHDRSFLMQQLIGQ